MSWRHPSSHKVYPKAKIVEQRSAKKAVSLSQIADLVGDFIRHAETTLFEWTKCHVRLGAANIFIRSGFNSPQGASKALIGNSRAEVSIEVLHSIKPNGDFVSHAEATRFD